jgi:hypothetical protein
MEGLRARERLGPRVAVGTGELTAGDRRRVAAHQPHVHAVGVIVGEARDRRRQPVAIAAGQGADRPAVGDELHALPRAFSAGFRPPAVDAAAGVRA